MVGMSTIKETLIRAVQQQRAGNLREAEQLYRRVLEADPNHAHALNNLGMLASQADRPNEAIGYLRRTLALQPTVAEFHSNLAVAYQAAHNLPAAVAEYREALRRRPTAAHLHVNLAQALVDLAELDEAAAHGREALRLQPGFAPAYGLLAELHGQGRHALTAEDVRQIQALLAGTELSAEHAAVLYYRLGPYWDQQGDVDEAFRCFRQANELKREIFRRAGLSFHRQKLREQIDGLMAVFTPDFFRRAQGFGNVSERPVFVVGMVRSGTTLVEQILASHPQVFGCGELKDIQQLSESFYPACMAGADPETVQRLAADYLQRLRATAAAAMQSG